MPSFTSTSFGLIIAFLVPGAVALTGLSMLSSDVHRALRDLVGTPPSGSGLVILLLAALTVGLVLSGLRWALFENWLLKDERLDPELFAGLNDTETATTFRVAIDEGYRHHQFWGG